MSGAISLRPISESDTENIVKWRNSDAVKKKLYTQTDLTHEQHRIWLRDKVDTGLCCQYIIVETVNHNSSDIGTVFIKNIDTHNHKGEFGIFIGEECARGKGYATLATKEMVRIAFEKLSLNRVYLTVMSDNIAGINAYKKAGFVVEGLMKEDYLRSDGYVDIFMMGITKEIWDTKNENGYIN